MTDELQTLEFYVSCAQTPMAASIRFGALADSLRNPRVSNGKYLWNCIQRVRIVAR